MMHPLPNYARRIEYLESTGRQWIDTGYVPTHDTEFSLRFSPNILNDGSIKPVHGNAYSTKNYPSAKQAPVTLWHSNNTNNRLFYSPVMFSNWVVGKTYDVRQGAAGLWINDRKIGEYSSLRTPPNEPMWLFRYYNGGNELFGNFKLFYWKAWQNGVPVRSFVPCRVGQTGYLWDEVTGAFFGNSGTGNFMLGTDIAGGGGINASASRTVADGEDAPMTRLAQTIRTGGRRHEKPRPALPARQAVEERHAA